MTANHLLPKKLHVTLFEFNKNEETEDWNMFQNYLSTEVDFHTSVDVNKNWETEYSLEMDMLFAFNVEKKIWTLM